MSRILSEHNFQEIKIPKLKGDPGKVVETNISQIKDLEADLSRIEGDIESIRKQFADFIISSKEHLAIEVLKAETSLRIAASENSFVIDGWIPTSRLVEIRTARDTLCCGLAFIQTIPPEKEEEPPVKLKNPNFSVDRNVRASLRVYDILGRQVTTLFDGVAEAGHPYRPTFEGKGFASGVYHYVLQSEGRRDVRRMILLR